MDIQTLRKVRPELANLDDETVVKAVALDYPNIPVEQIASDLGVKIAPPPGPPRTVGGTIGDFAISGLKGAIAVPEAAVGLADMATGGYAGKAAEGLGFRPAEARAMLDEHYSDPQKASFKAVNDAQGFGDTLQAAVTHPSTIAHSVVESLPLMGAGGVAGRGILALGERAVGAAAGGIGPTLPGALARAAFEANPAGGIAAAGNTAATIAGAAGEGISMAGQDAEQIRQANVNKDGLLTGEQTALAGAIGITGGGIALVGGMVAKKLGIHDVDTMLAAGQVNPIAGKGLVRSMLEGAFAEGVLEELPQSVVEQVLQNKAMGKPLDDGLDNAAVMGMLAGAVMGAGANAMGGHTHANVSDKRPGETPAPGAGLVPVDPSAGPLSAAAATAAAAGPVSEPGSGEHLKEAVGALAKAAQDHEPSAQDQQDRELNLAQQNAPAFPALEAQTAEEAKAERDQAVYDEATAGMPMKSPAELKAESAAIDEGAHQAATSPKNDLPEPTLAQKEAGNYQKGHINVQGLDISVENPQGSTRTGLRPDGTEWSHNMSNHYGYIKRTEGADGEHVDAYVGPAHDAPNVFVVDQVHQKPGFPFDEHKVMIGFNSRGAAVNAYKSNFDKGWMMGRVTEMPMDQFKDWLKNGDLKAPASPKGPLGTKGTTDATVEAPQPQATEATATEGTGAAAQPGTAAATGAAGNVEAPGLTLQQRRAAGKADIEHLFGLDTPEGKARAVKTAWQRGTPAARMKQLTAAGYTDGDQARVFSNTGWADLSQTVRDALGRDKTPAPGAAPQVVENKGNAEPRSGSNSQPESPHPELAKLVDRAETDFEYSPRDLFVDLPDLIADGKAPKSLSAAVDAYQNELDDDRDMGGRGDMDAADEALMAAVHAALKPEAAPVDVQKAMSGAVSTKHLTDKQVDQVAAMFDKKPAVSKNTIVTDEHAARARAILKSKLSTPMSTGLDPELMQAGITMALYHIERGARTFAAYSKAMVDDMGEAIRPYLKSWYMATKYDPRAAHFEMDDEAKINAPAEAANASASEGGSSLHAGRLSDSFYAQILKGNMPKDNPALKKLLFDITGEKATPENMKIAQEALEAAIVKRARDLAKGKASDEEKFKALLDLYQSQPNLNIRTSTSVENQAYSTPAPLAFLASRMAGIGPDTSVLEPTAGTGMLLMQASPKKAIVNELNPDRAALLEAQGFDVSQLDAAKAPLIGPRGNRVDAVIANPPFGSIKGADGKTRKQGFGADGYQIGQIDHIIAAQALEGMKDDGKAVLIIGANKVTGGMNNDDRIFFNWLYANYNVHTHFEVDGSMYTRQGASWPVRVIAIEGREKSDGVAPAEGTIPRAETWEQVYERYEQSVDASGQVVRGAEARPGGAGNEQAGAKPVSRPAGQPAASDGGRQPRGGKVRDGNVAGTGPGTVVDSGAVQPGGVGPATGGERGNGSAAASDRLDDAGKPAGAQARGQDRVPRVPRDGGLEPEDNQFQVTYVPRSANKDEGVLIPVNMAQPLQEALDHLEAAVGDIDQFAQKELGFASVDEMHDALMGLQVDSIASAIHQIKSGKGVIIADQTGIGKGRQAAAIIRWAARNDKIPVFITMKPELFSDMHGDLADIGTHDIAPFVMNAGEPIVTRDGERIFETTFGARRAAIAKMQAGEMPEGRNAVFMTYSQINQERAQRGAVQGIAHRAVFILDESHNAGGESNTGGFIKEVLDLSQGVTYLSATYAKRPDNMPLYFKTDMGEAVADDDTLMSAMENGGLPLQTVVSNNLVKAGQMFRRERSYAGIDIKTVVDDKHRVEHEKLSDKTTTALRAIVNADMMFHEHFVKEMQKEMEKSGGRAIDNAGNQAKASVDHTQFSSVVHNFVRQMLLGLKAQDAADRAIARLKEGYKPIIALENTMGSFLNAYAADHAIHTGDSLGSFDYRTVLTRALERTRYITIQDRTGTKVKKHIPMSQITGATLQAYLNAQAVIDDLELDIPVSPIDWMRQQITNAGHTVAEITGRDLAVDYSNPLKPKLTQVDTQEQNDKVRTTRLYNSGELDSLIINVSGSTGISLHSSEKFKDQRPRRMIVAQAAQDINILMQMLGRIHRTGQVNLPGYEMLTVDLPAERRPAALTSKKMKSLNANTSSNTESATSVEAVDMLNKYGDRVVAQYLDDNPSLRSALGLGFSNLVDPEGKTSEDMKDLARKATGRLALMPVAQQKAFYEDVESQYNALIEYLNKTNQNDLEPRTFDFDAKEVNSEKIFEGTNPASPFGSDANYGEYSVKSQGKPMTPEEISAEIKENLSGDLPAVHASKILQKLDPLFDKYAAPLQDEHRAAADAARARVKDFIQHHAIGDLFRVDINGDAYNAVVTNIRSTHKANGNPYSASKIQVSIAVNGGLRHLTLPATQFQNIEVSSMHKGYKIDQLFNVKAEGRETAKIITGNLLGAYGELQGVRGTIISFTKNDGTVEQGILLPKQFQMAENAKGGYRLRSGVDAVKFLHESNARDIAKLGIATRDGAVRITPNGDGVTIRVPKSKAAGAKYFLDKNIRAAAGDFASVGDRMVANVPASRAVAAIDAVMKKQAVYALPSHAETAKAMFGSKPAFSQPAFRQTKANASPAHIGTLQQFADSITEKWARKVEVVVLPSVASRATPQEVRDEAKALIARGGNVPSGVWYDGRVYAFADRISSNDELGEVIAHEVKGHMGLRGNFGDELDGILRQIAQARPAQVSQMIRKNGFKEHERLRAAEEILAEMAQKEPTLGFVRRAVAAIKTFLRSIGINTKLSDDEIIRSYLMPAAKFVEEGTRTPAPGAGLRFQQAQRTVQVDGVRRPDTNSKGQLIHPAFQGQLNFWRWFGDSKAIDEAGRPMVLYHGTQADFSKFDIDLSGENAGNDWGEGFYFTDKPKAANQYAKGEGGNVMPVYLAMNNPANNEVMLSPEVQAALDDGMGFQTVQEVLEKMGHDGIVFQHKEGREYIVFNPEQVKSAIGNIGRFDKAHADIMFSQYAGTNDPRQFLDYGIDALREYGATPGKVNWWHKTFGTMFDLAERNPVFKTVYDKVQTYLADISHYATEAADLAPRILPKIETWKDLAPKWAGGKKQALSVQEKTAIQAPIWEGNFLYTRDQDGRPMKIGEAETRYENLDVHERGKMLMSRGIISEADLKRWQNLPMASFEGAVNNRFDAEFMKPGIRWTDEELKSRYGLDDHTMGLYKEARDSLDRSVTRLSLSTMLSVAGKDARTIADQVMDAKTPMEGAEMIRDYLLSIAEQDPARSEVLTGTANKAIDIGTKAKRILDRGYAPAMRFGHYAVDVVDRKTGEREFFRLYEGRMEARRAAEQLAQEYPNAEIRRGTTSDEAYKQFAGVSPETLELFGEMLGLDAGGSDASSQAFQTFLKETKSNNSALRRLIERKGVPGYHEDISRVLAGFVYSNARQTSGNLHMGQIGEAVASVGRDEQGNLRDGELRDAAYRLMAYVKDPAQEAPGFRNLLFAQYLGGSVASALVNMTQPIQVTMPYLSQWGGVRAAAGVMRNALATAWKESTGNAELDHALKRAEEDGIVAPQETHQLQAYARGVGSLKSGDGTTVGNAMAAGSNAAAMIVHGWGKFFSSAELFNRRVTYVAAWNLAKQQGIKDADAFARKAVDSTQFVYNKGNRPEWARGAIGATLFTFKQYSISYMELMHRMYTQGGPEGKKAALFSLAMLMLMGGAGGLPFAEDAADVAEGIAQRFGYNLSVKQSRKELLNAVFGDVLGQFLDKGVSGIPGAPLDVSGRFGMGNLIPGTGLFVKKTDHTKDVAELAGPAGDFVTRLFQGANQAAAGKPVEGVLTAAPKAVSNLSKAVDMATSGMYKDAGGKKVIDTDAFDALTKAIGFQPNDVARSQEAAGIVQQRVAETRLRETEIADEWAKRAFAKDPDAAQWARAQVADWNEKNPDSPMRIQYQQILKRLREMNKTKAQRIEASSPKEMRASVRRELEGK